jgi:hypothetical protein
LPLTWSNTPKELDLTAYDRRENETPGDSPRQSSDSLAVGHPSRGSVFLLDTDNANRNPTLDYRSSSPYRDQVTTRPVSGANHPMVFAIPSSRMSGPGAPVARMSTISTPAIQNDTTIRDDRSPNVKSVDVSLVSDGALKLLQEQVDMLQESFESRKNEAEDLRQDLKEAREKIDRLEMQCQNAVSTEDYPRLRNVTETLKNDENREDTNTDFKILTSLREEVADLKVQIKIQKDQLKSETNQRTIVTNRLFADKNKLLETTGKLSNDSNKYARDIGTLYQEFSQRMKKVEYPEIATEIKKILESQALKKPASGADIQTVVITEVKKALNNTTAYTIPIKTEVQKEIQATLGNFETAMLNQVQKQVKKGSQARLEDQGQGKDAIILELQKNMTDLSNRVSDLLDAIEGPMRDSKHPGCIVATLGRHSAWIDANGPELLELQQALAALQEHVQENERQIAKTVKAEQRDKEVETNAGVEGVDVSSTTSTATTSSKSPEAVIQKLNLSVSKLNETITEQEMAIKKLQEAQTQTQAHLTQLAPPVIPDFLLAVKEKLSSLEQEQTQINLRLGKQTMPQTLAVHSMAISSLEKRFNTLMTNELAHAIIDQLRQSQNMFDPASLKLGYEQIWNAVLSHQTKLTVAEQNISNQTKLIDDRIASIDANVSMLLRQMKLTKLTPSSSGQPATEPSPSLREQLELDLNTFQENLTFLRDKYQFLEKKLAKKEREIQELRINNLKMGMRSRSPNVSTGVTGNLGKVSLAVHGEESSDDEPAVLSKARMMEERGEGLND